MYYAHSTANPDKSDWQGLPDHLHAVAEMASGFAAPLGLERAARLAGILHDLGKYTPGFQRRLAGSKEEAPHSIAGAALVRELATDRPDQMMAELVSYAIAGHHAGLPDMISVSGGLADRLKYDFDPSALDPVWKSEIAPEATDLFPATLPKASDKATMEFRLALLGRMLFSCLVDADFKETEAFYSRIDGMTPDRSWPALSDILPDLIARFDSHMAGKARADTEVNRLRGDILAHVRARAPEPPGLFTLTVPTGGGKTLASLAFALDHARAHGLTRVIYAIPFTSIIDQTADIFRSVLGDDVVLEHHSAIEEETSKGTTSRDKLRLAMEDWAAPIVVTTNVQLFESLFAARTGRCRKLHNIARSVIVLDEAQTLPRHLMIPCVRAIDELARSFGCSIVLCTATQPALDARHFPPPAPKKPQPLALPLEGRELAPNPDDLARRLKRVRLTFAGDMGNSDLIDALGEAPQALVIVNSRKHALDLFKEATEAGLTGLVHLTTRQVAAHRREILARVRARLTEGTPCRVIATSLIEAGVDVDFPRVWRAEAGLDQIAQAAGRCNREGARDVSTSVVTVFKAPDYPPPTEIKGLIGDLGRMAAEHEDLLSPAAIADYFGEMFWRLDDRLDRGNIMGMFTIDPANRKQCTNFSYRTAAEAFRMIESGMAPVIVAYDDKAKNAVDKLRIGSIPNGAIARELQSYIVQVPPKARALLIANGHVQFEGGELRADRFAVLQPGTLYKKETGLIWEDADYLEPGDTIIA
jgi:CRISPR-associated endonuclease/helicase Cas3